MDATTTPTTMLQRIRAALGRRRDDPRRQGRARQAGFTLLEIMIVLAIIAMIAGGVGVAVFKQFQKAKISTGKLRVKAARDAVTQYMIESPNCPKGIDELVSGKFLDRGNSKDPWGQPIIMRCPGTNDTEGADVVSAGPDKQEGTADDIRSWELN